LSDINFTKLIKEPKADSPKTIAVLPLQNLNEKDENLEYFSIDVTQEIIDELGKIEKFKPTPFTISKQYKDLQKLSVEITKELNVNYLISGSSRVFGDSVKLSIELFNPHTNERLWNGVYNQVMKNAPSIQLSIAKQVAKSLNIELTTDEKNSLEKANTTSGEAFNLFLIAKAEFERLTQEGFSKSIKMLEEAIELMANNTYNLLCLYRSFNLCCKWRPSEI